MGVTVAKTAGFCFGVRRAVELAFEKAKECGAVCTAGPLIHNSAGEVIFFRPVFNLADSCITCAVIMILLFYLKDLNQTLEKGEKVKDER